MGTYKSKQISESVFDKEFLQESPSDVKPVTRAPKPTSWRMNILRGKREDEIKDEAMPVARRKCRNKAMKFIECEQQNGKYWTVFECIEEYETMNVCFQRELEIEADKIRRDIPRHPEWWWREFYDEEGEIGEQAEWKDEWWGSIQYNHFINKYFNKASPSSPQSSSENNKSSI